MTDADAEFREAIRAIQTEPRIVTAILQFTGPPGMEAEAADAWAFELTYFFTRGVGEAPVVEYENGVYTVSGPIQTTHPHDPDPARFTQEPPWSLAGSMEEGRRKDLRELYGRREGVRFDGRDLT